MEQIKYNNAYFLFLNNDKFMQNYIYVNFKSRNERHR